MRTFMFSREIISENILDFVQKWEDGYLANTSNFYYSRAIKENKDSYNSKSPVLSIGMNMFYEKVIMNRKNVIVYYYSDWCSHCKKHLSLFDVISKKFNLVMLSFVHIDIGNYYMESIGIEDIPSIVLYPSNNKENPIKFDKQINAKNIIKFIKTQIPDLMNEDL